MSIWKTEPNLEVIRDFTKDSLGQNLGIEFFEVGDDYIKARMPVDKRTTQAFGLLHGGASACLAEELGSAAGQHCVKEGSIVVGVSIDANHLRSATSGYVTGIAKPIHLGGSIQVWEIKIYNEKEQLICISRLTLAVINRNKKLID